MNTPNRITYIMRHNDNLKDVAKLFQTTVDTILKDNPHINTSRLWPETVVSICPGSVHTAAVKTHKLNGDYFSSKMIDYEEDMRTVWFEHILWTRLVIISIAEGLSDSSQTEARLMKNPKDFADLYRPYYGDQVANSIEKLLAEHLSIAGKLVTAAKNGTMAEVASYEAQWYKNADDIAKALASINPHYNEQALKEMLYSHLALTKDEAVLRLSKNYALDIKAFNDIEEQALMMADELSLGVIKQFPEQFNI